MFDITSQISAQRDYDRDEDEFIGDDDGTGRNPRNRSQESVIQMITECAFSCRLLTPHLSVVASRCIYGVWIDNCQYVFRTRVVACDDENDVDGDGVGQLVLPDSPNV